MPAPVEDALDGIEGLDGEQDVVEHGEIPEERGDLEGAGEAQSGAGVRRQPGDILAEEKNAPRRRRQCPADQVEERGLARGVRADQGTPLARIDGQIYRIDGGEAPEALGEPLDSESVSHLERGRRARFGPKVG